MVAAIELCRSQFDVERNRFRILDWGCGRGKLVLWLREHGYEAFGADIDSSPFAKGAELFRRRGYSSGDYLRSLDQHGRSPFQSASFHFVTSEQTLEHVSDLARATSELRRLTMAGGQGFHIYPAHRRLVEPHLFMPCVHWLPKNRSRKYLIEMFVRLKIEPDWFQDRHVGVKERTRVYFDYSVEKTFYRDPRTVSDQFAAAGFDTRFVDVEGYRLRRRVVSKALFLDDSSRLVHWWWRNFGSNIGLATALREEDHAGMPDVRRRPTEAA
jgi:SAM-dependent methyltransferase